MDKSEKEKIIETIKKDHITPIPKWKADFKTYVFWVVLAVLVILSSLFFSLILLNFVDLGPALFHNFEIFRFVRVLVFTAPILWIGLLVLAVFLGIMIFRKTGKGYRYSVIFVMSLVLLATSVLGVIAHFSKMNEQMERGFARGVPGMGKMAPFREMRLHHPGEGMIAGEIEAATDGTIKLDDFMRHEEWQVFYDEETEIKDEVRLEVGGSVSVIGKKLEDNSFQAEIIRPLGPPPGGFVKGMQRRKGLRE